MRGWKKDLDCFRVLPFAMTNRAYGDSPSRVSSPSYPENTNPLDSLAGVLGVLCFLYPFSSLMSINISLLPCFGNYIFKEAI